MPERSSKPATRAIGEEAEGELASLAPEGRRIIAAVAIDNYEHHPQLGNAVNDAQSVLELFGECGFEELADAKSLFDGEATREAIVTLVTEQLASELAPDDSLVLFYAGHGEKTEKQVHDPFDATRTITRHTGYLIPADARRGRLADWIRLDGFLDDVSGLPARHVLVILDACKSGIALSSKFKFKGGETPASVAELRSRVSRRVITSALHDQKAVDGGSGSGHSLFGEAMIEAIRGRQADKDGDGFIKSADLHSYLQDMVSSGAKKLYGLRQTPDYGQLPGDGSGDLVLSLQEGAPGSRMIDLRSLVAIREAGEERGWNPAFAGVTAMEVSLAHQGRRTVLSAPALYDMAKARDGYAGEGTWLRHIVQCMEEIGVPVGESRRMRYRAECSPVGSVDEIPEHLEEGRPVLTSVSVHESWFKAPGGWIASPPKRDGLRGAVAIVIVMYEPEDGSFGFALTWGPEWGDRGFGYMSRETFEAVRHGDMWAVEAAELVRD
jgi:hypothetical protein